MNYICNTINGISYNEVRMTKILKTYTSLIVWYSLWQFLACFRNDRIHLWYIWYNLSIYIYFSFPVIPTLLWHILARWEYILY